MSKQVKVEEVNVRKRGNHLVTEPAKVLVLEATATFKFIEGTPIQEGDFIEFETPWATSTYKVLTVKGDLISTKYWPC